MDTPVMIDQFGGLQLSSDPEQVGLDQAVDALNTDVSVRGELRCRPGTTDFYMAADVGHNMTAITRFARYGAVIMAQDTVGIFTSSTSTTDKALSFANFGTPAAEFVYYAYGPGTGIGKVDSALAFSHVAGAPAAAFVAVTPVSQRLVAASGGYDAKVSFSDAGDPETFGVNNYVDLDPGDDELFRGMVTWRDMVFVFKETRFFIFTGESVNAATGTPVFDYRSVKNSVGVDSTVLYTPVCAGVDGVYFIGRDGIYHTTGETPVKVSGPIDAWFKHQVDPLAAHLPSTSAVRWTLGVDERRLYFGTSGGTFVMDFTTGQWTVWSLRVSAVGRIEGTIRFTALGLAGKGVLVRDTDTTDSGVAIPWFYRTGASDFGVPVVKTVAGVQAWGVGAPTVSVFSDDATVDGGASVLTLGATGAERGQAYYSRVGSFFSVGLAGAGTDRVNRVVPLVREQRVVGVG